MRQEKTQVVIVGGGAAGTGAAYALERRGVQATLLDGADPAASSVNNQCWGQSGLFYLTNQALALKLWQGWPALEHLARAFLLHRGASFLGCAEDTLQEREANAAQLGIPLQRIPLRGLPSDGVLGAPACVGGVRAPDASIDFPDFLASVRDHLVQTRVVMPARVTRLLYDGERITGVLYAQPGEEVLLHCRWCIVTLGAWSVEFLQAHLGLTLPVQRWKSHILTFEGELVDQITAFWDGPQITLVPVRGTTLVANARRVAVQEPSEAHAPLAEEVEAIETQLATAFPRLCWRALKRVRAHG
jgi:glycerol-3-phosphate dehydrogenase